MNIIGLPGRNLETEAWMQELLASLDLGTPEVLHYRHWDDGGDPDVPTEARRLEGGTADLVIAKSMGTLVAASAYDSFGFVPSRAVLIGCPVAHLPPEAHKRYRQLAERVPTLLIQQRDDLTGSYDALAAIVAGCACARAVEIPGADHVYPDLAELVEIIRPWVVAHAA